MDAFSNGVIIGQSFLLLFMGYMAMDTFRIAKRGKGIMDSQTKMLKELLDFIRFQHGLIMAVKAGVIDVEAIDFSNLPFKMRIKILYALIDVGVQAHLKEEG